MVHDAHRRRRCGTEQLLEARPEPRGDLVDDVDPADATSLVLGRWTRSAPAHENRDVSVTISVTDVHDQLSTTA